MAKIIVASLQNLAARTIARFAGSGKKGTGRWVNRNVTYNGADTLPRECVSSIVPSSEATWDPKIFNGMGTSPAVLSSLPNRSILDRIRASVEKDLWLFPEEAS